MTQLQVKLEPSLMAGEKLGQVYYMPDWDVKWYLLSQEPKIRNVDEFTVLTADEAVERFPEIEELLALKLDWQVMFRKGKNSGRWIDFV